jgi:hypothetical protein
MFLAAPALALAPAALADWKGRAPSQWRTEDIQALLTASPWARESELQIDPSAWGKTKLSSPADYRIVVTWDSALPMRLARGRSEDPGKDRDFHILSVGHLPMSFLGASSGRPGDAGFSQAEVVSQLGGSTWIEREGRKPIRSVSAEWLYDYYASRVAIRFPRPAEPITLADREVYVRAAVGTLRFRVRFPLKPMVYRGKLEL